MKKFLAVLLLIPLVLMIAGCGPNADQVLKDTMKASKNIKTAHFVLETTTKLPRAPITEGKVEKQNYVQKSKGDYDLSTGDFQVETDVMGAPVKMLQVGDKQYWQVAGNWYEVPQSAEITPSVTSALSISQYMKYFKELKKLGDTKIDGEACYHIQGIPDMKEFVKQPGVTDLLKDPSGKQIRTVDELQDIKAVFNFFIRKKDNFFKRSEAVLESKAPNEFIQMGFAEPGDMIEQNATVTFSDYNKKLNLKPPSKFGPLPTKEEG